MTDVLKTTIPLKDGSHVTVVPLDGGDISPDYTARYLRLTNNAGIHKGVVRLYLDTEDRSTAAHARAATTETEIPIIIVNDSERRQANIPEPRNFGDDQKWAKAISDTMMKGLKEHAGPIPATHVPPEEPLPKSNKVFDDGVVRSVIELKPEDMTPESHEHYLKVAQAQNPKRPPAVPKIYLDMNDKSAQPHAKWMNTGEKEPVLLINPAEHQWSSLFVVKQYLKTDAQMAQLREKGDIVELKPGALPAELGDQYHAMATDKDRMDIASAPSVYLNVTGKFNAETQLMLTREGKKFVVLNPDDAMKLDDAQVNGVMAHELSHGRRGLPIDLVAQAHNTHNPQLIENAKREEEHVADVEGAGPRGTCDPKALAQALQKMSETNEKIYLSENKNADSRDYLAALAKDDRYHPPLTERIDYFTQMAAHPPEECKDRLVTPAKTPAANLPAADGAKPKKDFRALGS